MYGLTCPECSAPMDADRCARCGWQDKPPEPAPEPAKKRRKRRPEPAPRVAGGERQVHGLGPLILLLLYVAFAGLSAVSPLGIYGLLGVGGPAAFVGMAWVLFAARVDGIGVDFVRTAHPLAAGVVFACQLLAVPIISIIHMVFNFQKAWQPAATLFVGVLTLATGLVMAFRW